MIPIDTSNDLKKVINNFNSLKLKLNKNRDDYVDYLDSCKHQIINNNYIIVVNEVYTIGLDESNITKLSNELYPLQFTEDVAKKIINEIKLYDNEDNRIMPTMVFYKDYYRNQIEELNNVINNLEKQID